MKRKLMVLWGCVVIIAVAFSGTPANATTKIFYSDGVIQEGDGYDIVEVHDTPPSQTTVDMTGGWAGYPGMSTFDASVVNISGGFVGYLQTNDSSTVNISGGLVGHLDVIGETTVTARNQSNINVYDGGGLDGGSFTTFELLDSSTLNVYGGDVHLTLLAYDSANINMYDGSIFDLGLLGPVTVDIYGGHVGTFLGNHSVPPSATVNFYGSMFEYNAQELWSPPMEPGQEGWWTSKLTGYGPDGTPITYLGLPDPSMNPNINLIPEPATVVLIGIGAIGLLARRKHFPDSSKMSE